MCVGVVIMCMCDMCVVSNICSWKMTVIRCGVCVERLCNVCVVLICVGVYVLVVVCVLIYELLCVSMRVYQYCKGLD